MEQSTSSPQRRFVWLVFLLAWAVFFVATFVWNSASRNSFDDLPAPGNIDGIFYDNIAFNLAQGEGFIVDFEQPTWRRAYELANEKTGEAQLYNWVFQFQGSGPTTMRSPGYPYMLSWVYRTFGWRIDVVRYAGMLMASFGLAALIAWCCSKFGYLVAFVASLTIVVDYSVMQTPGMIASEPLAILMFSLTFVALAGLVSKPTNLRAMISGLAFALLFLTRGNWNLGLLLIIAMSVLLVSQKIRERLLPLTPRHIAIALLTAICVGTPWWIRNCWETKHFQPFGTAGASGMVAAYCDESLADYGNWKSAVFHRNQRTVFEVIDDMDSIPLAEREFLVGRSSMSKASAWALENWYQLPKLAILRYLSHWGLFNAAVPSILQIANAFWLIFGLIGCLFLSGRQRKLIAFVLLLDALIVMLTWPHLGRYGIPIRPVLHVGCALLIVRFWQYILFDLIPKRSASNVA